MQRFREGFTTIPPMRELGKLWDRSRASKQALAARHRRHHWPKNSQVNGVDFSFALVLMSITANRRSLAIARFIPIRRSSLFGAFAHARLERSGVTNVEHFPWSWLCALIRTMRFRSTNANFLRFGKRTCCHSARCPTARWRVMPAHVTYPKFDSEARRLFEKWLKDVLRGRLGFDG